MKKIIFTVAALTIFILAQAKVWRINNTLGVVADFTTIPLAVANAAVVNDDTLHIEASATSYNTVNLTKRLVIIGTGYFLSGANGNLGLQQNSNTSLLQWIAFDSTSSGSQIIGIDFNDGIYASDVAAFAGADNITITRCKMNQISMGQGLLATNNNNAVGWVVNKCHIGTINNLNNYKIQNLTFTNNIVTSNVTLNVAGNLNNLIRNNVFRGASFLRNAYFSNNIFPANFGSVFTTCTLKNNTGISPASGDYLPFVGINGNTQNNTDANLFQGIASNSTDGQWRLKAGSLAIAAGETIGAITPDCGAYGTADPYVLSGIPAIPTIYLLTVPTSVASSATTMPITISTKSNN